MSLLVRHWWGWVRHITRPDVGAYLNRFTLFRQGASGTNPWRLYLHQFLAADMPLFHNHPSRWSFSLVLWGSYTEEVLETDPTAIEVAREFAGCTAVGVYGFHSKEYGEDGTGRCVWCGARPEIVHRRHVRWFNWIPASKYHRITALHPGPGARGVWTLFICGPLQRDASGRRAGWGFWRDGRHVDHSEMTHTKVIEAPKGA